VEEKKGKFLDVTVDVNDHNSVEFIDELNELVDTENSVDENLNKVFSFLNFIIFIVLLLFLFIIFNTIFVIVVIKFFLKIVARKTFLYEQSH
jgi:hypothetical protein